MKNLTIEAEAKFRNELKTNLEGCGICYDSHILKTWYECSYGEPKSLFDDNGERVMIKGAIEINLSGTYNVYVDVQFDSVSIWKPNKEKECFDFINVFWFSDYKNKTALSMAVACELVSIANKIKED